MRALITALLTVLFSTYAFAGNKAPIADSVLLGQLQEIDNELADYSHKARAIKGSYRILFFTSLIANNGYCPIAIPSSPDEADLADLLEVIEQGINNNTQTRRQSKKIHRKLKRVLRKLIKRRTVDQNDTAELGFGITGTFDYGTYLVGQVPQETFVLTNGGTQAGTINTISFPSSPFFVAGQETTCVDGLTLQVGESCEIAIDGFSFAAGNFSDTLSVDYNNGQQSVVTSVNMQITYQ